MFVLARASDFVGSYVWGYQVLLGGAGFGEHEAVTLVEMSFTFCALFVGECSYFLIEAFIFSVISLYLSTVQARACHLNPELLPASLDINLGS